LEATIRVRFALSMRYGVFDERRVVLVAALPVLLPKGDAE
jgi:hypothetical protein